MPSGARSGNKVSSGIAAAAGPVQARLQNISWAFATALALHALFVVLLVFSFAHSPAPKKTVGPKMEVVQAVAVDESQVQAELDRIRQEELRKQQAEQARLRKLEQDARKARQEREQEQQRLAEVRRKQAAEQKRLQEQQKAEQARLARLKSDRQALEQKRKQEELQRQEEARKKKEAEAKRLAEEQRKRDEAARLAREEELRQQLAAEEQRLATLREKYIASIQAKVQRNWRRPAGVRDGATCEVLVSQLPGGLVHTVSVSGCSGGDEILERSVKTAVLKSEPLPAAPDPSVFDREIRFVFLVTR